jgi:hypothetical protein
MKDNTITMTAGAMLNSIKDNCWFIEAKIMVAPNTNSGKNKPITSQTDHFFTVNKP